MSQLQNQIQKAINFLQKADRSVVLTGAGISTPSGIPDFRSPMSGAWETADPMTVASIQAFRQNPQVFYDWIHPLAQQIVQAKPNAAHLALSKLEQNGFLEGVITQNIDMLHTRAGSQTVYELHGHLREVTCMHCHTVYNSDAILPAFIKTKQVPTCTVCQGVLKPNVILYGEMLPMRILKQAQQLIMRADLLLVVGSSLEVSPAGDLPWLAKQVGAKLIFVNLGKTHLDEIADLKINADVVDVLPQIASALMQRV